MAKAPSNDTTHARARAYEVPTRDELVRSALEIRDMALEKTCVQRDGTEGPSPELNSALKAVELAGKLLGIIGDGRQLTRQQLEQELDTMGYELRPKLKRTG